MSIDLSLDRLLQLLPHLPYTRPTLHIAGTNGKGSVSAYLTSILLASSPPLRIGRFNSPHLVSVYDCITFNDVPISPEQYARVRGEVEREDRERGTKLTGFEILTMSALRAFEHEKVDVVVLEVGMGGRLDATNVVPSECILVSALASVDLDHQAFLGETVAQIAREKAGIARVGRAFVMGRQEHGEVGEVVREVVGGVGGWVVPALKVDVVQEEEVVEGGWSLLGHREAGGPLGPPSKLVKFTLSSFGNAEVQARLPLHGAHQLDNLGTALTVIDSLLSSSSPPFASVSDTVERLGLKTRITLETIVRGIESVKWAGRLSFHALSVPLPDGEDKVDLVVLADGAHNPASAKTLGAYITELLDRTALSSASASASASASSSNTSPSTSPPTVPITYILSLSHSPPKTPLQTLSPILPPSLSPSLNINSKLNLDVGIALLPFSPPQGMPWVRTVPLDIMRETVEALVPGLGLVPGQNFWVASASTPAADGGNGNVNAEEALKDAFRWAARRHAGGSGLVVLAGSLYLVADFYRLLSGGF